MIGQQFRLLLAISYWETRKVPGWFGAFFCPFHNMACDMRADQYRRKLKRLQSKSFTSVTHLSIVPEEQGDPGCKILRFSEGGCYNDRK
jgi:hypothetical protein